MTNYEDAFALLSKYTFNALPSLLSSTPVFFEIWTVRFGDLLRFLIKTNVAFTVRRCVCIFLTFIRAL